MEPIVQAKRKRQSFGARLYSKVIDNLQVSAAVGRIAAFTAAFSRRPAGSLSAPPCALDQVDITNVVIRYVDSSHGPSPYSITIGRSPSP